MEPEPLCLADFEPLAANRATLDRVAVLPRVLAGAEIATRTRLLQSDAAMPVGVAPMAYQRLVHPDGEMTRLAADWGD